MKIGNIKERGPAAWSGQYTPDTDPLEYAYAVKVVVAYENDLTRLWAEEVCGQVTRLVGQEWLRKSAWRIGGLTRPHIFAEAAEAATRADVIVVSVLGHEEPPTELCAWFEAWLPGRPRGVGALVSLIGLPENPPDRPSRFSAYLQAVAEKAGLDYLPHERRIAARRDGPPADVVPGLAQARRRMPRQFRGGNRAVCRGWRVPA